MEKEILIKLEKLVNFLQDNTGIAEYLDGYGHSDEATENTPEGGYACIERYLIKELSYNISCSGGEKLQQKVEDLIDDLIK